MIKLIAIVVLVLIVAILGFAATRPDTFRVERSTTIKAPPETIFAYIEDLRRWSAWSPYEKRDPAMKRTYGGAPSGTGATYAWEGDANVGTGRMAIVETSAPSRIAIKLDFLRPFEAHNTAEFTLRPAGDTTHVTWAMYGPSSFVAKLMGLFLDMDAMIGKDFAEGLANLKAATEG